MRRSRAGEQSRPKTECRLIASAVLDNCSAVRKEWAELRKCSKYRVLGAVGIVVPAKGSSKNRDGECSWFRFLVSL